MKRFKNLVSLFFSMLKIGLFTFGGGYAMIGILENEFVSRKKAIEHGEFVDLVAIAESTPGPIAINCATYIGYKNGKILGSLEATLGMVLPSFTVIYLISLFFDRFISVGWVFSAFKGIQVCVIYLILSAGLRMLKKMKKDAFCITVFSLTLLCMLLFSLLSVGFSSIFYILISGAVGLLILSVRYARDRYRAEKSEVDQ